MARGKSALEVDKKGMFRFNAGMEQKTMPDYNPYTIKRCKDCDMNNGNMKLVFVPENELCAACKLVRTLANADAKQIKKQAKPLQGTVITNNEFPFPVNISKRTLQEWRVSRPGTQELWMDAMTQSCALSWLSERSSPPLVSMTFASAP